MIGRIYSPKGSAVLQVDGVWRSDDATLAACLNALFCDPRSDRHAGPSDAT